MNLKKKDIVLLPYPFTDLKGMKVRPAIVISNDDFNSKSLDCIMVPLTSVIKDELHSILITQEDLTFGKLIKPSRIRVDKVFTVEKRLVKMKIGTINQKIYERIKSEFFKLL